MNIYDIAERSRVSIATVSRVLNESPKVSPETRERVLKVIEEENYTPNAFAQSLGLGTMKVVGILCTDASDICFAQIISTLEQNLRIYGFSSILICTGDTLEGKKSALDFVLSKNVDAIFLVGSVFLEHTDNSHIKSASKKRPIIMINGLLPYKNVYSICCDQYSAMKHNVKKLFEFGCRNLLYVYDVDSYSGLQKLSGFNKNIEKYNINSSIIKVKKNLKDATSVILEAIQNDDSIDGIVASEDLFAVAACKALEKLDKSVPVIGFNNSVLAECATPAITSVDIMVDALCISAVQTLNDLVNGTDPTQKILVSAQLVERDTFKIGER